MYYNLAAILPTKRTQILLTMKKLKFILTTVAINLATQLFAQIPNAGFESWTPDSVRTVEVWNTSGPVIKVSDAQIGTSAIKLETDFNNMNMPTGTLTLGELGGNGYPYASRADTMKFYAKYFMGTDDSGSAFVYFSKLGSFVGYGELNITGSSGGAFVELTVPIGLIPTVVPDTVFIMFNNSLNEHPDSWLIIDNIRLYDNGTQTTALPNFSFENWNTFTYQNPNGWLSSNLVIDLFGLLVSPVSRDTSHSGAWAIKMQNMEIGNGDLIPGIAISTENFDYVDFGPLPSFPISSRYKSLKGYYKWKPINGDTATVKVFMFKNGVKVGAGTFTRTAAVNSYTLFEVPIIYDGSFSGVPDSAAIELVACYDREEPHGAGSTLWIDDLSFSQFGVGIPAENAEGKTSSVFPNPFSNTTTLTFYQDQNSNVKLLLLDATGKIVKTVTNQTFAAGKSQVEIRADDLPSGIYFYQLQTLTGIETGKIIRQ